MTFRRHFILGSCWIEVGEAKEILRETDVEKHLPVPRLEDVQRQRHTRKQHYRQGKEWELVQPTHFIAGFAHLIDRLTERIMAEGAQGRKDVEKFGPRFSLLGYVKRGPSSTPSDKEGFSSTVLTDAKGSVRPDVKESARTVPAYEQGSTGKCSPACLQAQRVWRKSRLRLR